MITYGITSLALVMLAGAGAELYSFCVKKSRERKSQALQVWRKERQAGWKVTYPPVHAADYNSWDIPVFVQKVEK